MKYVSKADAHPAASTPMAYLKVKFIAKIIGTSGMSIVEKPPYFGCESGRMGLLSSMFTNPDYRRMEIAKSLLDRVIAEARQQGCQTVQITASNMGVNYTAPMVLFITVILCSIGCRSKETFFMSNALF